MINYIGNTAKKLIAALLCLALIFSLCSCSGGETVMDTISNLGKTKEAETIDEAGFTIPYLRSDSLDPYKASESMNRYVSNLIYDPLFTLDSSFEPVAVIAESSAIADKTLTVNLKSGLKFTDGSALSSKDVVYSFNQAKDSAAYAAYLENFESADADGDNAIAFKLSVSDGSEAANLTFPIVKSGSYEKSDDDGDDDETTTASSSGGYSLKIPVGSGRYTFMTGSETKYLQYNKDRLGGYKPKYAKIGLIDVSSSESLSSFFDLSKIDFYCDTFDNGKYTKFSKISSNIDLTNFVYIGINSKNSVLSEPKVRRAIALALNRSELASDAFAGCAVASSLPFHPSYYKLKGCTAPTLSLKTDSAKELLEEVGYSKINDSGARYNGDKVMSLTLLVNSENDFRRSMARGIQQALEKINIKVTLKEVSYSDYSSAVKGESFDMYIGETELSNNFSLARFFSDDGGLKYGISEKSDTARIYEKYLAGKADMQSLIDAFSDDLPFIPLAFRQGITVCSDSIKNEIKTVPGDCFANIDEWTAQ